MRRMRNWVLRILPVAPVVIVLFGLTQGTWSNWLTLLAVIFSLSVGFFFILLGRDFFDIYSVQFVGALIVLYVAAIGSADLVTKYNARSDAPPHSGVSHNPETPPPTSSSPTSQATPHSGVGLLNPETPGTLLVLFVATITVVGFTVTVKRLQESHVRITTYEAFLSRLERLLSKTLQIYGEPVSRFDEIEAIFTSPMSFLRRIRKPTHFYGDNADGLKILCHVPTLGNMSHQSSYLSQVHGLWLKIGQSKKIPIETVCVDGSEEALQHIGLSWDYIKVTSEGEDFASDLLAANRSRNKVVLKAPIGKFYNSFAERGFSVEEIRRGVIQAVEVIREMNAPPLKRLFPYDWPKDAKETENGFAPPDFSLFWTRTRAIIAFPLDRRIPRVEKKKRATKVTMVGYETTDPDVIDKLLDVYEEFRDYVNSHGRVARNHRE